MRIAHPDYIETPPAQRVPTDDEILLFRKSILDFVGTGVKTDDEIKQHLIDQKFSLMGFTGDIGKGIIGEMVAEGLLKVGEHFYPEPEEPENP